MNRRNFCLKDRLLQGICGAFGPWVIEHIGSSLRWEIRGEEHWEPLSGRPHVLAFWHARMLIMAYFFRHRGYHILASENTDGELITRAVAEMGIEFLRGSTSRGAQRVLLSAARLLKTGRPVAFTPDGPRGPRHVFQGGAIAAARLGGVPILPVTASVSGAFVFPSWDRFVLPRDGARAVVEFLPPIAPPPEKDLEPARRSAERSLAEATDRLDAELGLRIS
ncbi:lysophospholipid acyltransferase family protein [bacterium]|nr:lysophospholipid acyltransferase family protein [bacterium]